MDDFEKLFGFKHTSEYARRIANSEKYNAILLSSPEDASFDIKDFSVLYTFSQSDWSGEENDGVKGEIFFADGKRLDFTNEIKDYLLLNSTAKTDLRPYDNSKTKTLTLQKDGWTVIFTRLEIRMKEGAKGFTEFYASGFVCK